MLATTCYTRAELDQYLHGRADDDLSGAIEDHLGSCARCEDTLSELDTGDDTLIRTLQVKSGGQTPNTPMWVARMANMPYDTIGHTAKAGDVAASEPPPVLGDYELVGVLGRGGMSVVSAARHKHLGREVALKVLLPTTQQHAVSRDRFTREMRAVGGLDHAAIIRATDAGECNETLYLVMERIDGVDLNRVSKSEGPLRAADACAIGIEVARGLAHAHRQGVVHRDIKPSNVMLDRGGNVKILDFGLARMQSTACDVSLQTTMGQLLGTLDYMAPEQASGCNVDTRPDIYALGATLFKLLAGTPPHGRSAEMPIIEFLNHLATNDASRLDAHRDQLPSELVELVASMLQRDPDGRIASAVEVAERLEPHAGDANLRELAASAAEKTANSPENSLGAIKTSLADIWPNPLPAGLAANVTSRPKQSSPHPIMQRGQIGAVGWAALATGVVSLCGLVALTIILTLKSPEGEIRIESELENVKVEVVDEKDRVDVIAVEQGAAITTVRAGRYRIRLDSPADGIEVTPQEVIVTKDKVVIAKVRKIPTAKPAPDPASPQRDPIVAIEAQVQLAKTMDELADAKRQTKPNERMISSLEEKLSRLRALSRPIPTEPVYEGRTLDDWVAQMKFEQEATAKRIAASNVLNLAVTRPDEERMELILDAGSRLLAWDTRTIENRLYVDLTSGIEGPNTSSMRIMNVDRQVAVSHLVRALQSDDRHLCDYALTLCVDLRNEIRQGKWPGLPTALEARNKADTGAVKVISQLIYAMCLPDAAEAVAVMVAIDLEQVSEIMVLAMIYAALDRHLEIPRAREIAWVAKFLDTRPYIDKRRPYPTDLITFWFAPTLGPFRGVHWDHPVDAALQADVNMVVAPLLKTFEQRLASVADNPLEEQRQVDAAVKANMLTVIVNQVNLTGETQHKAVKLLNRRLEQLLQLRATRTEALYDKMDTPADIAIVIMLLTGEVPASIKQLRLNETGDMAGYLVAARTLLTPKDGVVSFRGTAGMMGQRQNVRLADWYPYELLTLFLETASHTQTAGQGAPQLGDRGFFSRQNSPAALSQLTNSSASWNLDPRLMLDFGRTSASAAEFVNADVPSNYITPHLLRHPEFARMLAEFMEGATSREAVELGYKFWSSTHNQEEVDARLLDWLKSGGIVHTRFAMRTLADTRRERFFGEWAMFAANAIDRIAAEEQLDLDELDYLDTLQHKAPQAASHAIKYLNFWLDDSAERHRQALNSRRGGGSAGSSVLKPCASILLRSPEQAKQVKAKIRQKLNDPQFAISAEDRGSLERLMARLPEEE